MTSRQAALTALGAYRREKAWPEDTLCKLFGKTGLSGRDAALATRLVKGVLQNGALLDYYIDFFSAIKLSRLEPPVLDILRVSAYQIAFLDKIPSSAAVNEGVAIAKRRSGQRTANFVNAILRAIAGASEKNEMPEISFSTETERLSIQYSHPQWLVQELTGSIGKNGTEAFLKENNKSDTPVTVQANTLLANADELLSRLLSEGARAKKHDWMDGCLLLQAPGRIAGLQAYKDGLFYVQDLASRLTVLAAAPKPGDFVIDGCAAPGGKSFSSAIAMGGIGKVTAFDLNAFKLSRVTDGANRMKLGIVEANPADASTLDCTRTGKADVVFADVPCSGFGVIRKKPEIRYKAEAEIKGLPEIQRRILSNLSGCVKPGGKLIYSTCTVLKRENEDVVHWFLKNHPGFSAAGFSLPGIGSVGQGMITLWPQIHGTDGFFICKLVKEG